MHILQLASVHNEGISNHVQLVPSAEIYQPKSKKKKNTGSNNLPTNSAE